VVVEEPQVVKSADRVLAVLDLLAEHGAMTFSAIADALKLPKSSAHNLLHTIASRGYIDRDPERREYRLGYRLWQLAQGRDDLEHLRVVLRPLMTGLGERTRETVQMAVLDGVEALYLEIVESPHPMKLASRPGVKLPAHASAVGKALLASLDPAEAHRRLAEASLAPLTERTLVDVAELDRELARIRHRGYSTDNEEFTIGCRCVAMPIHGPDGAVVAAMSVSIPTPRYTREFAERTRADLAATVAAAGHRLGAPTTEGSAP
jgi:IclR family KDG regulon transcriptional repressor